MKSFWAAMSIFRHRRLSSFQSLGAALSLALAISVSTSACKLKARNQEGLDKLLRSATLAVSAPTVASVSTTNTTGTYILGSTISIQVTFTKPVIVAGSPQLTVSTGAISTQRKANYFSGSGSDTLTFKYTVENGDYSSQVNYASTSALTLNSGTIKDLTNIDAILTLPETGSELSLAGTSTKASKTIQINSATLAQSTLSSVLADGNNCTTSSSCKKTQTTTIRLTSKDSEGHTLPLGGLSISFSTSPGDGVSIGTIGPVTDNGDGTYQATFTADRKGTAITISASIAGSGEGAGTSLGTVENTTAITVINSAPEITSLATKTYPLDGGTPPAIQGGSVSLGTATDVDGDSVTLSCTYKTLGLHTSDPNYAAAGTNCNTLNTIAISGSPATVVIGKLVPTTTGTLSWTPTYTQRGTYQFTINATDGETNASSQTATVAVRAGYTSTNLLSALDALNSTDASGLFASTPSAPLTSSDTTTNWLNLLSSASNGTLIFGTMNPWGGTGQSSTSSVDPYRLSLTSTNSDSLSLGTVMNTATQFSTETWVKPSPLPFASPAPIIIGNGGGTGDGFVLRQSQITPDRAEFVIGKKYYSYKDLVLSHKPVGYWRFNETSGTTAVDISAYSSNGTYTGTSGTHFNLNQPGAIFGDSNQSAQFNGGSGISFSSATLYNLGTGAFSFEGWFKTTTIPGTGVFPGLFYYTYGTASIDLVFSPNTGNLFSDFYNSGFVGGLSGGTGKTDGNWHHFVISRSGTTMTLYMDGSQVSTGTNAAYNFNLGGNGLSFAHTYNGHIDDYAIYNYALTSTQVTEHYQTGINGNYKIYPGNAVLADRPVGYWRLGEKSGLVAADLSGNNNSGTYTGGYTLNQTSVLSNSGDSDSSTLFNGSTGYVTISDHASYASSYASAEAWFYPKSLAAYSAIVNRRTAANSGGIALELDTTGTLRAYVQVGGTWYNAFKSGITINNWYHAVATYNGTQVSLTVNNGTPNSTAISGTLDNPASPTVMIGKSVNNTTYFNGMIDEVALYNYALSSTQIAAHYNSGNGPGWWTCQSLTLMNNSNWNLLSTLYNGTTAKLFVNGEQECSVTPGTTYSGAVANTVAGSNPERTSNFWTGLISSLKIFGTSNSTAPATAATIQANFISEANRYRSAPIENIVMDGLVFHLDAANAKQGLAPFSNGCAPSDQSWFDLATNSTVGTFFNFSSCGASLGWLGNGTVANPYSIKFNGTTSYITIPWNSITDNGARTISVWFKTSSTGNYEIIGWGYNSGKLALLGTYSGGIGYITVGGDLYTPFNASNYANNQWHNMVYSFDGSTGILYLDSVQKASHTTTLDTNPSTVTLGRRSQSGVRYYNGSVATAFIYNRSLNAQEVKQNCLAQEGRFTLTPQSICAAP